jgi:MFS family permease
MSHTAKIDVFDELANARVGRLHKWLGAMMAAITLFDGYDTFNPAYVIHYVSGPWGLAPSQAGLLISSGLVGFLIGAGVHGIVADRIGRRVTLLGGLWITSVFTLATPLLGDSFVAFCLVRVLTGVGLGVLLPLATTYINELAPRHVANTFSLWGVAFGWALGGTLAGVVGVFLTPMFGWKVLYWIGALSIPLTIALHFFLPESIKFMALQRRTEDIRKLLARLRPERELAYRGAQLVLPQTKPRVNSVAALLVTEYRRTTLTIWLTAFLSLFCIFGLTGWIPTVMMKRGETFAASFAFGAMLQVMSFVGGLVCGYLADRSGSSRGVLGMWWGFGGLAVLSLVVLDGHAANLVCTAAAGFCIIGAQYVLNNFTARSYETGVRATAVGMMLSVGRVGAILGPFVVGAMQQVYPGPTAMFVLIGGAALVAALAILTIGRQPDSGTDRTLQPIGEAAH